MSVWIYRVKLRSRYVLAAQMLINFSMLLWTRTPYALSNKLGLAQPIVNVLYPLTGCLYYYLTAEVDVCESQRPCQHGSTCTNDGSGGYHCLCQPGYIGTNCEREINECDPMPCQNGGTCTVSPSQHTPTRQPCLVSHRMNSTLTGVRVWMATRESTVR